MFFARKVSDSAGYRLQRASNARRSFSRIPASGRENIDRLEILWNGNRLESTRSDPTPGSGCHTLPGVQCGSDGSRPVLHRLRQRG
jgi:hypothetical protein